MRRDSEYFADHDLELVYIAKRLSEAKKLEEQLTGAGWDYLVEPDLYRGGLLFVTERTGAFFYVLPEKAEEAREFLRGHRYKPQPALPQGEGT